MPAGSTVDVQLSHVFVLFSDFQKIVLLSWTRLAGLVVKATTSGVEDPGLESRLRRDLSGSSHISGLKIGTPVSTLPGV